MIITSFKTALLPSQQFILSPRGININSYIGQTESKYSVEIRLVQSSFYTFDDSHTWWSRRTNTFIYRNKLVKREVSNLEARIHNLYDAGISTSDVSLAAIYNIGLKNRHDDNTVKFDVSLYSFNYWSDEFFIIGAFTSNCCSFDVYPLLLTEEETKKWKSSLTRSLDKLCLWSKDISTIIVSFW